MVPCMVTRVFLPITYMRETCNIADITGTLMAPTVYAVIKRHADSSKIGFLQGCRYCGGEGFGG